ncbi:hypothetical protein Trichorick_01060 [Candidatus Trichorickettsia mobilis]|uniref:DUF2066 domain-containing protein n=1 Tax=Candidatus Trichorickettsia mobilis TaxID=1346319 RepID=A0ABZ0UU87_9RICK|nr:hypothetical protein [Candidatus Trichorickettsia mobilis]WPY01156.1 hypothetical protein Trichorick_01060 [Candidatus Trichorickettsia mobilis]
MKKLYKQIILHIICIFFTNLANASLEVSELYIEAQGNNKYESKIKAQNQGMQRAFLMVADTLGINASAVTAVPYLKLKDVFTVVAAKNVTETDNLYKATVTYQYNLYPIQQLLFQYGNNSVKDRFYEYLILPISKQKNILTLWDGDQEWNKKWSKNRNILDQAKLFYPKSSMGIVKKINADNVLTLSFSNFLDIFPTKLLKKVMLIVCEYFTDINTGAAVMDVKYIIIDNNGKTISNQSYPLNNLNEVTQTIDTILKTVVNKYGRFSNNDAQDLAIISDNEAPKPKVVTKVVEDDIRTIILDLEAFTEDELTRIKDKLQNISDLESFSIAHNYDEKYKVTILTKSNDYKLAESFYLNGLSFKMYGNLYSLIDVIKGGG